jgi:tyrosyl-tRNA synthetase
LISNLFEELTWRGMVYDATDGVAELLAGDRVAAYTGIDPTASSLHVGLLLPVLTLARLQRFTHSPLVVIGGGTGMIGDPKPTQERPLLSREDIERNVAGIRPQLARVLDFESKTNPARIINNADWLASFDLLGFLRDTGKFFTVNYLLQKEAVSRRLESDEGISFTEFSYPLLQARDYYKLHSDNLLTHPAVPLPAKEFDLGELWHGGRSTLRTDVKGLKRGMECVAAERVLCLRNRCNPLMPLGFKRMTI